MKRPQINAISAISMALLIVTACGNNANPPPGADGGETADGGQGCPSYTCDPSGNCPAGHVCSGGCCLTAVDGGASGDGGVINDGGVTSDGGTASDGGVTGPGPEFDRFCRGSAWDAVLTPGNVHEPGGAYLGVYRDLPVGSRETMKVIPPHPFWVTAIRVDFVGTPGPVKVRLMRNYGRSYPHLSHPQGDLIPPVIQQADNTASDQYTRFDVSDKNLFLLPTEHYILVNERLTGSPFLAVEEVAQGDHSRALMHVPGESYPYGSDGNFRMSLEGKFFCQWEESSRLFGEDMTQSFRDVNSQRAAFADLNGDGHDDLILNANRPIAFFGDGRGSFSEAAFDPFPDAPSATMLVFGDLDNDGDVDAFAASYVNADGDGDGVTIEDGDCDDTNKDISPNAPEVPGNGKDDNCDQTADEGTDTSDGDNDQYTIAQGDCDDTRDDVYPGAPEKRDGRDNNCNGQTDEIHVNKILLNDGQGHFSVLENSGVEVLDQSTAAAFGDGNGDGKLDLYWGNWLLTYPDDPAIQDRYFTGSGSGTFSDAQQAAGLVLPTPYSCYGVIWNDYNNDGHQDIFVGNYHLYANQLWKNQGDGTFIDVAVQVGAAYDNVPGPYPNLLGGHTFGGDFADVDNDGDLDMYMANLAHPRAMPWSDPSMFLINQGPPDYNFTNKLEESGFIYDEGDVNAAFADFDNDMDVDLVVASLYTGHYSRLYRNDGLGNFTDITYESNTAVHDSVSVVWSDVDEDGDLDLLIADRAGPTYVHLFINRVGQNNRWVQFVLRGTATNRDAIGARVTLEAGGVSQLREIRGGQGHSNTQNTKVVHFGLGQSTQISQLTVRWVGGATEAITGAQPNGRYLIVEGSGQAVSLP